MLTDPNGLRLPWSGKDVPHAALDLLRGCNVSCDGCYNTHPPAVKPFDLLCAEVDQLMRLRRLQALTLTGGEPTLHPRLIDIARYIKAKKLRLGLLTNGLLLDDTLAPRLAEAGVDIVLLHIQSHQRRTDLPPQPTEPDRRRLRAAKAELVHRHGMEVGITGIGYPDGQAELRGLLGEVMTSPHLSFLLMCRRFNPEEFEAIDGHIGARMVSRRKSADVLQSMTSVEAREASFAGAIKEDGLTPFAYIGSSRDPTRPKWVSFFTVTLASPSGTFVRCNVLPSESDARMMTLMRRLHGRYTFYFKSGLAVLRLRLTLSALSNPGNCGLWRVLLRSFRPGTVLREKHVVLEQSPEVLPDGEVVYCRECPDATLRNGVLMPPCLADRCGQNGCGRSES